MGEEKIFLMKGLTNIAKCDIIATVEKMIKEITELLKFIKNLKIEYNKAIGLDKAIKADPYDNVARWKVCDRIERYVRGVIK